ncbi:hypothetical protein HYC85_031731 [Camellia sinensis]|uniref:F-box domain-containing protein n=1 Tax=Camellia sinensis TaxID=4442 RepID=A0A7J7FT43_CAMSI|nr:hypothetical protein HYC85_031731 [Camellia sinensis]
MVIAITPTSPYVGTIPVNYGGKPEMFLGTVFKDGIKECYLKERKLRSTSLMACVTFVTKRDIGPKIAVTNVKAKEDQTKQGKRQNGFATSLKIFQYGQNWCLLYAYIVIVNQQLVEHRVICITVSLDTFIVDIIPRLFQQYSTMLLDDYVSTILSNTLPLDACRSLSVSSSFHSTANFDIVWERLLPSDYEDIVSRSVTPLKFSSKKEIFVCLCDPILTDELCIGKINWVKIIHTLCKRTFHYMGLSANVLDLEVHLKSLGSIENGSPGLSPLLHLLVLRGKSPPCNWKYVKEFIVFALIEAKYYRMII